MIFSRLPLRDRKTVRLVCKSWYEACCQHERIRFLGDGDFESFRAYGLRNLEVTLSCIGSEWSLVSWQEIAARIRMLELYDCMLGDGMMKSVIQCCENLRILRVTLQNYDPKLSFCSPETLEEMNVVREKLETFMICGRRPEDEVPSYHLFQDQWRKIFVALFRIFPKIQRFTLNQGSTPRFFSSHSFLSRIFSSHGHPAWLAFKREFLRDQRTSLHSSCSFSTEAILDHQIEKLSSGLALLRSDSEEDLSRALVFFSALRFGLWIDCSSAVLNYTLFIRILFCRFTEFSVDYPRSLTSSLQQAFLGLFETQQTLVSVQIKLGVKGHPSTLMERKFTAALILQVILTCRHLRELEFGDERYSK